MAYGTIYTTQFYDYYDNLVVVNIQKKDYVGASTALRSSALSITYANSGFFDPIISLSADLVIINNFEDFDTLSDLLKNHEKQYKAIITRAGQLIFEGFMLCDITEQQLYKNGSISITFTDYLKRLEDAEFIGVELGLSYTLIEILEMALAYTGLNYPIYINCRLFPTDDWDSSAASEDVPGNTLFEQVSVEGDLFYSSVDKIVTVYEVIESILKTFHCKLYAYQGAWYVERYSELLDSVTDWTLFEANSIGESAVANGQSAFTKQSSHFKYTDLTQLRSYISGLKTFEIQLNDMIFESLVHNNWPTTLNFDLIPYTFDSADIQLRKWYADDSQTVFSNAKTGLYDIDRALFMRSTHANRGIYYKFRMSWNALSIGTDVPTNIEISWKQVIPDDIFNHDEYIVYGRFYLMVCHNDVILTDKFVVPYVNGDGVNTYRYRDEFPTVADGGIYEIEVYGTDIKNRTANFKTNIDLSEAIVSKRGDQSQEFVLAFLPMGYKTADGEDDAVDNTEYYDYSGGFLGDFVVTVNAELQDNNILATITEDFVKTDSVELSLFDTGNLNLKNGMFIGLNRTRYWEDPTPAPSGEYPYTIHDLVYFLVRSVTAYSSKTRSILTASILTNYFMKPLSALYDTDIKEAGDTVPFILNVYSFDLVSCINSISADEYGQEPIILTE